MTIKTETPGLLRTSQGRKRTTKKPTKVTTTVRIDADLKARAEEFARINHMDFTTFLSFSIRNTMQYGGKIEPYYEVSDEYAKKLEALDRRIENGEEKIYGPFSTKEENRAFLDSIK